VFVLFVAGFLSSCAHSLSGGKTVVPAKERISNVRTTAYTHSERSHRRYGRKTACGTQLSSGAVKSAASDWSRFPVGTKFRILQTNETYCIDDYGSALVGTDTIDLYKPSPKAMRQWGVRYVDIEVVEWGSRERSLQILRPRARYKHVRKMIHDLERKG
jgi:3D (Asp-Asp-Asp) domain-containing protein